MNMRKLMKVSGFAALLISAAGVQAVINHNDMNKMTFATNKVVNHRTQNAGDDVASQVDTMCANLPARKTITARWCELRR